MRLAEDLRGRVAAGQTVLGTFIVEMKTPATVQILQKSGFDFCIVDTEHGCYSADEVRHLIAAAKHAGICPFVRVSLEDPAMIARALDAGAEGIMVPMCRSMEDVSASVMRAKYPPMGKRGLHLLRPHVDFNPPDDAAAFCRQANANLILAIQIETTAAAGLVDEIAATEGVDMLYVGPGDLGAEMGHFETFTHPEVRAVAADVGRACREHGKMAGSHCGLDDVSDLTEMGIRAIGYGAALRMFWQGAEAFVKSARERIKSNDAT
jgi:2-keto-3-deoxy-L-rhamnonate aldolase RhmA